MMVAVGLGWSVLPRTMLHKELVAVEVEGLELRRTLGVVRHTGHTLSNAARAMLERLRERAASEARIQTESSPVRGS